MKRLILETILILKRLKPNKQIFLGVILFLLGLFRVCGWGADSEDLNMHNPFGVLEFLHWNHPWNNYKYSCVADIEKVAKLMKEAGVGWVRMDFLWEEIEPREGDFQFGKYDKIVEVLYRNNIHILALLDYSAYWARVCPEWNCPPKESKFFANYAAKMIEHYKDKIKYWEVWNEPDSSAYWKDQDGMKGYCALLKEVYVAAKKIDPDCKILNGGLANGVGSINRLYDNGAKDYFDILNIHFFENPAHKSAIESVKSYPKLAYKIMSRNGDAGKKIWITEIGCPGVKQGITVKNWWMGSNPDERAQAEWVKMVYAELLKDGNVEKIFWAFFRDCQGHWDNGVDYFGMVRWDYSKKPSFGAYQRCFHNWKKSKK